MIGVSYELVCFFFSNTLLHDFVVIAGCLRRPFPVPSMFGSLELIVKETSYETAHSLFNHY